MEDFNVTIGFVNIEVTRDHHRSSAKGMQAWMSGAVSSRENGSRDSGSQKAGCSDWDLASAVIDNDSLWESVKDWVAEVGSRSGSLELRTPRHGACMYFSIYYADSFKQLMKSIQR